MVRTAKEKGAGVSKALHARDQAWGPKLDCDARAEALGKRFGKKLSLSDKKEVLQAKARANEDFRRLSADAEAALDAFLAAKSEVVSEILPATRRCYAAVFAGTCGSEQIAADSAVVSADLPMPVAMSTQSSSRRCRDRVDDGANSFVGGAGIASVTPCSQAATASRGSRKADALPVQAAPLLVPPESVPLALATGSSQESLNTLGALVPASAAPAIVASPLASAAAASPMTAPVEVCGIDAPDLAAASSESLDYPVPDDTEGSTEGFTAGERVQVWSQTKNSWLDCVVDKVYSSACIAGGYQVPAGLVQVSFEHCVKYIRPEDISSQLRRPPLASALGGS